tara:strand:+ start:112 stop:348 length:237 start_codon:yes stop_codon:yes gene_type:complete
MPRKTRLYRALKKKGIKQGWLAQNLGIHRVDMSRYATGLYRPRYKERQTQIANFFGMTREEMFPPDKTVAPEGFIRIV